MAREHNKNWNGVIVPDFGDFLDIIEGETTIGFKYDGIGALIMTGAQILAVLFNLIFGTGWLLLIHSIVPVISWFVLGAISAIKKDYETYLFRRMGAIVWPVIFSFSWFISGGIESPTGYLWMILGVSYNTSLVTGRKSKYYIAYAILINIIAMAITVVFPQTLISVFRPDRMKYYNIALSIIVAMYIFMTFWLQRKIAENMQDKLAEYNEELIALNEEIETNTKLQMEMQHREELMVQQKKQADEMTKLLIRTLSDTIEAKDEYTRGHSSRVSEYAELIAKKMGLPEEEVDSIRYAATLHDIGKIGVPDTILNKPSKLTDEEYSIIKTHSSIGADILKNIEIIAHTADIAGHHHERYDGKGYPEGLKADEISIGARIVAIADSFDAMNSRRIYRKPLSRDIIISEITKNRGIQFDPEIADAFLELLESGAIDKIASNNQEQADDDIAGFHNEDAEKILSAVVTSMKSSSGSSTDLLTGLSLRSVGEEKIAHLISEKPGALIFCDMDNLKTINDRYGHKSGDKALKMLGEIIGKYGEKGVACRIGGDEFLLYLDDVNEKSAIELVNKIDEEFRLAVKDDQTISVATLSAGICLTKPTDIYANVLSNADKALYHVKQRGKAGYYIFHDNMESDANDHHVDIGQITKSIEAAGQYDGALNVEYRQFTKMYDYLHKVCERYGHTCSVILVTLDARNKDTMYIDEIEQGMNYLEMSIRNTIRNVDICTRYSSVQYLIILFEAEKDSIDNIMSRAFASFYKMNTNSDLVPRYETSTLFE